MSEQLPTLSSLAASGTLPTTPLLPEVTVRTPAARKSRPATTGLSNRVEGIARHVGRTIGQTTMSVLRNRNAQRIALTTTAGMILGPVIAALTTPALSVPLTGLAHSGLSTLNAMRMSHAVMTGLGYGALGGSAIGVTSTVIPSTVIPSTVTPQRASTVAQQAPLLPGLTDSTQLAPNEQIAREQLRTLPSDPTMSPSSTLRYAWRAFQTPSQQGSAEYTLAVRDLRSSSTDTILTFPTRMENGRLTSSLSNGRSYPESSNPTQYSVVTPDYIKKVVLSNSFDPTILRNLNSLGMTIHS